MSNPWRESLVNCANGDNELRLAEYYELADYIDGLLAQLATAARVVEKCHNERDTAVREERKARLDLQNAETPIAALLAERNELLGKVERINKLACTIYHSPVCNEIQHICRAPIPHLAPPV